MKCFQLSCWCRLKLICTNGRHLGRLGLRMRCIAASCGVRLAFFVLHSTHEHTMFSQLVGPPRSRGITWSRFRSLRSKTLPQYWQVFLSRSKMLCRVNLTSFFGRRSKSRRTMTRGIRILKETVWTISSSGSRWENSCQLEKSCVKKLFPASDETTCAWPWQRRVKARRTEQTLTACHNRLRTRTCRSSMGKKCAQASIRQQGCQSRRRCGTRLNKDGETPENRLHRHAHSSSVPAFSMRRILLVLSILLFGLSTSVRAQSNDPSELFLNAYMAAQQGERLEHDGNLKQAAAKYRY